MVLIIEADFKRSTIVAHHNKCQADAHPPSRLPEVARCDLR